MVERIAKSLKSRRQTFRIKTRARQKMLYSSLANLGEPSGVIWIFGCQRSGTTFLENIFRHDLNSVVFGEFSELTIGNRKTVLRDVEAVKKTVLSKNAKYAVIRPLFESDRAVELLDLFPNSVGIWLFRDAAHVVDSMLRKWGRRFFEISREVESDECGHWRLDSFYEEIRKDLPSAEQYARYWLERNTIPYKNALAEDPRMLFMSYPAFVSNPRTLVEKALDQIGFDSVWKGFKADARTGSIDKPVDVESIADTLKVCDDLYLKLLNLENRSHV